MLQHALPQTEMGSVLVVQVDNATPIVLNREKLCVAKIKNEQIALPGDYFQRMGIGRRV